MSSNEGVEEMIEKAFYEYLDMDYKPSASQLLMKKQMFKAGALWALEYVKNQRFQQYMTDMQTDFANKGRK